MTTAEGLDASDPQPAEVGGAAGQVLEVRLNDSAPECIARGATLGITCYIIHGPLNDWLWVIEEGRPARIWILDVDGETVLLMSDSREDRFDNWVTTIDEVVATLEW